MKKTRKTKILVLGDKSKFLRSGHPILKARPHLECFELEAIEIEARKIDIPKIGFDFCLISSANVPAQAVKRIKAKQWIFIGGRSYLEFRDLAENAVQVSPSSSLGIVRYFRSVRKESPKGARIFFPRSSRGDTQIIKQLRALGFRVVVRHVYDTKILNFSKSLVKLRKEHQIDAVFFMSPSGVSAFKKSVRLSDLRKWKPQLLAIGPTTERSLRALRSKI